MPQPQRSPVNYFIDGLRDFMDLRNNQVVLFNQHWKNPNDDKLYIVVSVIGSKPYGNTKEYQQSTDGSTLNEILTVNTRETWTINMASRTQEALDRKEEVLMFLNSDEAQQICEEQNLKFASIPVSFVNIPEQDGAGVLNRFALTMNCLRMLTSTRIVQYFDTFQIPPKKLLINP